MSDTMRTTSAVEIMKAIEKETMPVTIFLKIESRGRVGSPERPESKEIISENIKNMLSPLFNRDEVMRVDVHLAYTHESPIHFAKHDLLNTEKKKESYLKNPVYHALINTIAHGSNPMDELLTLANTIYGEREDFKHED